MDYQYYQPNNSFTPEKRSRAMETASLILGAISIATSCFIYAALFCGALSIMFALLSRGGEMTLSQRAKIGLILGIAGIGTTILLYAYAFFILLGQYGSLANLLDAMASFSGFDSYEQMRQSFMGL